MPKHSIRKMKAADLEIVYCWRTHPSISSYMFTDGPKNRKEHKQWFRCASKNSNVDLFVYEFNERPTGFVKIIRQNCPSVAEWGFFLAPEQERPRGLEFGKFAVDYLFNVIALRKISAQVLEKNLRSLRFHKSLGFNEVSLCKPNQYEAIHEPKVVQFELLATHWGESHER